MTQNRYFLLLLLAVFAITATHCNQVKETILPHTYNIFPVEAGQYRIYDVIDTTFNTSGPVPNRFYFKEEISGKEIDLENRTTYRLDTYLSDFSRGTNYDFQYYLLSTVFFEPQESGDYYAERIENNIRTQVLKFPVNTVVSWNGNLYNNQGTKEFYYQNVDTTVTVKGVTFENCVMVIQEKTKGLIRDAFAYEIYAPEIGLIKKYNRTIVTDGAMGEFNPDASRIYIQEIVDHN